MSIQDESFPTDEFLDELDFSPQAGLRFQFPPHQRQRENHQATSTTSTSASASASASTATTNTSASSSASTDQNLSTESVGGRPSSCMSGKTTASDPDEHGSKKVDFAEGRQAKAVSYQDIHSEYTKRRFKHVESKVGQYIASMKAEDQKRREARFQRHRSMPETLGGGEGPREGLRLSAGELHRMFESCSDVDVEADSSKATSSSCSSSSTSGPATARGGGGGPGARAAAVDEPSAAGQFEFVDKHVYAQIVDEKERIQSYSEYLQTKLDEKLAENMRLKRNVEFMRIELANCKDKLKQKQSLPAAPLGGRLPLQSLLYCQAKSSKATQTERPKTPPPPPQPQLGRDLYVTPDTPDANNNTHFEGGPNAGKTVATIQPLSLNFSHMVDQDQSGNGVLRQRSNSNSAQIKARDANNNNNNHSSSKNNNNHINNNNSRSSCPSSSDSAIDIEAVELPSPKAALLLKHELGHAHSTRSLRREEFIYYDQRSGRYATLQALNAGGAERGQDENEQASARGETGGRKTKKHLSLRRRWMRFFGPCTRCNDQSHALDNSALQQTYTQIPLLEKSFENHCRNIR